ncbi:hypothetical protein BC940DRAFT_310601 [Gongronella butleri]|nr:hypothetical protein BC940DRAFT_310601 [Gongronella butleri]
MTAALVHSGGRVDLVLSVDECNAYHISPAFADVTPQAWYDPALLVSRLIKTHGVDVLQGETVCHHIVYAVSKIAKKQSKSRVTCRFFNRLGQFYQRTHVKRAILRRFHEQQKIALLEEQKKHLMDIQVLKHQLHVLETLGSTHDADKNVIAAFVDAAAARAKDPTVVNATADIASPEPHTADAYCVDMEMETDFVTSGATNTPPIVPPKTPNETTATHTSPSPFDRFSVTVEHANADENRQRGDKSQNSDDICQFKDASDASVVEVTKPVVFKNHHNEAPVPAKTDSAESPARSHSPPSNPVHSLWQGAFVTISMDDDDATVVHKPTVTTRQDHASSRMDEDTHDDAVICFVSPSDTQVTLPSDLNRSTTHDIATSDSQ